MEEAQAAISQYVMKATSSNLVGKKQPARPGLKAAGASLRRIGALDALHRTVNKAAFAEAPASSKMIGWLITLIREVYDAKRKSAQAVRERLRPPPEAAGGHKSGWWADKCDSKPSPQEVAFWRSGDIPFMRLPELLFEFLKEKYGAGRTAEKRLADLAAAASAHRDESVFVRIFLRFLSEQWEHSTLVVFLRALTHIEKIRINNPACLLYTSPSPRDS
eukprot:TRINITY_DN47085_c0_g1_i1.p1 TRINITY_DN47085_c0_g1~~TRINITY_DN47085_c0_g1_i1.p1  ORF type:complete len:219 (-),score=45.04 TRINITY_DN47085_c0_g1_i1:168-824(-)